MRNSIVVLLSIVMALSFQPFASGQGQKTIRDNMNVLSEKYGINFVYDSSLSVDLPYRGRKVEGLPLEKALDRLFSNSGISWEKKGDGYVVLTKAVEPELEYDLSSPELNDTITEALVVSIVDRYKSAAQTGLTKLDFSRLSPGYAFLSSPDLIKTLQALPGVASGTELMSGLYVRGGTGSDNLFLLDGVPLYQMSHSGGLFSSFNTDIIEEVDFYKSGFPARYGSRLSSVVDVKTREGNMKEYHGNFSIGLIDGRIQLEGPIVKDRTSFNVAMRRSWLDVVTVPAMAIVNSRNKGPRQKFGYSFHDVNAKLTHRFSDVNALSLNFYNGLDSFRFRLSDKETPSSESPSSTNRETSYTDLKWGNIQASLEWKYDFSDNSALRMVAYYSGFNSDIGFDTESRTWSDGENVLKMQESNKSEVNDLGYAANFSSRLSPSHHLRYGANYQYHIYNPSRSVSYYESLPSSGESRNDQKYVKRYYGHEASAYIEDDMTIFGWFKANIGARYVMFAAPGKIWHGIEPRAALRFQCADVAVIKLSYTEINQFCHQVATTYLDLPTSCWLPSTAKVRPMLSRQAALGLSFALPKNFSLNLEGFYKTMEHIREYGGKATLYPPLNDWEEQFKEGRGRSYGVEAEFAYQTGRTYLAAAYTLSWSQRKFEDFWMDWYPDRNDNRHKITLTATRKFSKKVDVYVAWNYHTGNRMTASSQRIVYGETDHVQAGNGFGMELFSEPNNVKLPDYHRLDVGVNFRKTTKRGNERVWNISLYNVYCRMNAVFATVEVMDDGSRVGKATGIIPIIPSFSYSLKF